VKIILINSYNSLNIGKNLNVIITIVFILKIYYFTLVKFNMSVLLSNNFALCIFEKKIINLILILLK